ncbi:MAG: VCBS domain-containing protein, partial [Cyanobacteria bacterium J06553_1]
MSGTASSVGGQATPVGSLTIDGSGNWTYSVDNSLAAIQTLTAGEVLREYFEVTTLGGDTQVITIDVTGSNDGPVSSGVITSSTTEGSGSYTLDMLGNASDADDGEDAGEVNGLAITALPSPLPAGVGVVGATLSFDPTDSAYGDLAAGETRLVSVTYDVVDDQGATVSQTVQITVTGTNDRPVAVLDTGSTFENAAVSESDPASGLLANDGDDDASDVLSIAQVNGSAGSVGASVAGSNGGTFVVNADGTWSFNPGSSFEDLAAGETRATAVSYTVSDDSGTGNDEGTPVAFTVTVTGTNDAPVISVGSGSAAETLAETNAGLSVSDTLDVADVDTSNVVSASVQSVTH